MHHVAHLHHGRGVLRVGNGARWERSGSDSLHCFRFHCQPLAGRSWRNHSRNDSKCGFPTTPTEQKCIRKSPGQSTCTWDAEPPSPAKTSSRGRPVDRDGPCRNRRIPRPRLLERNNTAVKKPQARHVCTFDSVPWKTRALVGGSPCSV